MQDGAAVEKLRAEVAALKASEEEAKQELQRMQEETRAAAASDSAMIQDLRKEVATLRQAAQKAAQHGTGAQRREGVV